MSAPALELVRPRVQLVPEASSSRGAEAVAFAREHGVELDPWQELVLEGSLGVSAEGEWAAFESAQIVPRQNGKSETLLARTLFGLYVLHEPLIVWSAHQRDTALECFRRLVHTVEEHADLAGRVQRVLRSHGEEGLELDDGCRVRFRTRTGKSGRGYTADVLIVDEAHYCDVEAMDALLPALSARRLAQVWFAGSAVDQLSHESGVVLARLRERGHRGDDGRLAFFEWSAELLDEDGVELRPDRVYDELVDDEELWARANPALGTRISVEHVRAEREAMDPRGWLVERLGVGDWPATTVVSSSPIAPERWLELVDPDSSIRDPVVVAFDVSPDRRAAIAAAGRRADDLLHVEVVRAAPGTAWLVEWLERLTERHDVDAVVADGYGPAGSVIAAAELAGVPVVNVTAREHAAACARLLDLVGEGRVRHRESDEVLRALRGAKPRPLGDAAWAWSRKNSNVDVSPLVACRLALWRAAELPEDGEVVIY